MQIKPYPKYKDSGIDWIGDIPEGWQVRRFSSFGFFSSSGINKKTEPNESLVKMVNYTDIYGNDSLVIDSKRDLMTVSCPKGKIISCDLKKGDIVFTPSSETEEDIGLSAVIFENLKNTVFSYHVIKFRTITKINLHYKKYIGNNHFVLSQFSSICKGTTRQILTHNDFKSILTILPPFPEQITIANFLDKKIAELDELIEKDKKLIGLLKEKRTALINHAVTKGLPVRGTQTGLDPNVKMKDSGVECIGEIPEGWEVKKLKFVSEVYISNVDKKTYPNEHDVLLCFMKATANIVQVKKLSINKNDVIITKDSETIEEIAIPAIVTEDFQNVVCGYHLAIIRSCKKEILGKYLFRLFQSKKFSEQFSVKANGVTRYGISTYPIKNIPILLPPKKEQAQIVNHLDKHTTRIDKTIQKIEQKIKFLEEYKKSLIHHAVTGKIDIREVKI